MTRQRLLNGVLRGAVALLAVGLAALAVQHGLTVRARQRAVLELLAETGLSARQPDAARAAATDPDPVRAKLAVARALLAEAIDYRSFGALPARDAAEAAAHVNDRLELAREIAAEALAKRPSAWQAAMILGGATYRLWSSRGDRRVFSERAAWEAPLREAARLAPGEDEPLRFLAVAWLEIWPALTAAEHKSALITLRRAFQDPQTFARCAELWLAAVHDRDEASTLVPDDSRAWSVLENVYAGEARWDDFCAARQRRNKALERELRGRVSEAAEHLRGGDQWGARSLAVGVVAAAPVELAFRDVVRSALAVCPPGPMGSPDAFQRWVGWAVDGLVHGQMRLPPEAVARLAAAAGGLGPVETALSELAAGDLAQAEVVERRNEAPATEAWAPYWVAKTRVLADRREISDAKAALARVHRSWRTAVPTVEAQMAAAEASRETGELVAVRAELDALASTSWPATGWRWRGPVARLDLLAATDAPGLSVRFDEVPPAGAVAQLTLDGATVAVTPVRGAGEVRVTVPVGRGSHLLEVEGVVGGRVVPGEVELIAAER